MENTEVYVKPIVSSRLPPGQSLSSMSPRTASMSPRRESSRITPDQSDDFNCASFISEDVYPSRVVRLRLRILPQPLWPDDDLFRHFHPTMMVTNDDDGILSMIIMVSEL